jgi:short-subunit dehydrogenase
LKGLPMALKLKPLREQVVVITGASSGIGLATAKLAARRGARLVLASRNEQALMQVQGDLQASGAEALVVVADVGREEDVRSIADAAIEGFGGFDTWINNAGASVYGRIEQVPLEDHRRVIDTNFWGVVYGSRIACETLRERGGTLINVGSIVSERAIPLQGMYSASKHAVMGFTEALRMELMKDDAPVSVTLIMPGSIDTPFPEHAKAYVEEEPTLPPPVYHPNLVAEAMLYAAEHPKRTITVGGGGRVIDFIGQHAPWLTDKVMEWTLFGQQQKSHQPVDPLRHDSLYRPRNGGRTRGHYEGHIRRTSVYTKMELHPLATAITAVSLGLGALVLLGTLAGSSRRTAWPRRESGGPHEQAPLWRHAAGDEPVASADDRHGLPVR